MSEPQSGRLFPFVPPRQLARWQLPTGVVEISNSELDAERWLRLGAFVDQRTILPEYRRRTGEPPGTDPFTGNWIFQNLTAMPLFTAGFLFAVANRVPLSLGAVLLDARDYFQNAVLPGDVWAPLEDAKGSESEPSAALIHAVEAAYEPIISSFASLRLVSPPNARSSVFDSLHQGFLLAGRTHIGLDAAWERWEALCSAWPGKIRRRPRRLQFSHRRQAEELTIHASCCLVFSTTGGALDADSYCAACPVKMDDGERIDRTASWIDRFG